jgi:hypothetical protein
MTTASATRTRATWLLYSKTKPTGLTGDPVALRPVASVAEVSMPQQTETPLRAMIVLKNPQ